MFKGIVYKYLFKAILIVLICLVAYGACSAMGLAIILILFVGLRFSSLVAEAFSKPAAADHWDKMLAKYKNVYGHLSPEHRAVRARMLKMDPHLDAGAMAQAQVDRARRDYAPPRSKRELAAEFLGVVAYVLLVPLVIALYTREIFSLRGGQDWAALLVTVICTGLYAWPKRSMKSPDLSDMRILWWAAPFFVAFPLLIHVVATRHPYLNPFEHDRHRLAAERVLSLKNNVVAGQYADWVMRYARQLDERGDTKTAILYYREALRLDANDRQAYARLSALEAAARGDKPDDITMAQATGPYWSEKNPVTPSLRGQISSQLENVEGCTIVIVPVGDVSDEMLDDVGFVIRQELHLAVCISTNPVAVPPYTRKRGLAVGPQWDQSALVAAFTNATKVFPVAPIRYLLLTPVDIYMADDNYIVSASYPWGALLSSARYGDPGGDVRQRTAKQALCAVIKSFGIPASPDRNDVTSYARSAGEFDVKGDRPDADTLRLFRQAVMDVNRSWVIHKGRQ